MIQAAKTRLRPILLTTVATVVGKRTGLWYWRGRCADYAYLGYGLPISVPIVLFIVPCLYVRDIETEMTI